MWDFYYPDGTKIASRNDFIDYYSRTYYLCNNPEIESIAIEILDKQKKNPRRELSKQEIRFILLWKTNGIMYPGVLSPQMINSDSLMYFEELQTRSAKICINEIQEALSKIKDRTDIKEYLKNLLKVKGIGNTYAVTLTYFVSGGKFMIYDQFVDRARTAILKKLSPNDKTKVEEHAIMDVSIKECIENLTIYYNDLNEIFGGIYNERKIDQALWTYGHLFKYEVK